MLPLLLVHLLLVFKLSNPCWFVSWPSSLSLHYNLLHGVLGCGCGCGGERERQLHIFSVSYKKGGR